MCRIVIKSNSFFEIFHLVLLCSWKTVRLFQIIQNIIKKTTIFFKLRRFRPTIEEYKLLFRFQSIFHLKILDFHGKVWARCCFVNRLVILKSFRGISQGWSGHKSPPNYNGNLFLFRINKYFFTVVLKQELHLIMMIFKKQL